MANNETNKADVITMIGIIIFALGLLGYCIAPLFACASTLFLSFTFVWIFGFALSIIGMEIDK